MQCDEFDARLQKLLDLRRTPQNDPRLRRHAQACAHCAQQLAATARLLKGLELWEVPPLADDFAQRVVQQVAPADRTRHARWIPWAVAVAAVLLIGVLPGLGYWLRSHRAPSFDPTSTPTGIGKVASSSSHTPPGRASSTSDESPWTRYGNSILGLYPEETRQRHRQQVSEFAEDLRPIASPFNAALTAIRRTIPVNRSSSKSPPNASVSPGSARGPAHA